MIYGLIDFSLRDLIIFFLFLDDYNRVVLSSVDDIPDADYINASYVDVSINTTSLEEKQIRASLHIIFH